MIVQTDLSRPMTALCLVLTPVAMSVLYFRKRSAMCLWSSLRVLTLQRNAQFWSASFIRLNVAPTMNVSRALTRDLGISSVGVVVA